MPSIEEKIMKLVRDRQWWYFVAQMVCLFLIFAMAAVVLGLTANWEANGIDANVGGEVACAPLVESLQLEASNRRCVGQCLLTKGDICVPSLFCSPGGGGCDVPCFPAGKGPEAVDGPALGCCLRACADPTFECASQ